MNAYTMTDWQIPDMPGETIPVAVNSNGDYIGDEKTARFLCQERGIEPELAYPGLTVCSIGFCEKEQKWYGWSHRAIFGFGIGSTVKRGDCGYVPVGWDDFLDQVADFWRDEYKHHVTATRGVDGNGRECAKVAWEYDDKVPNEKLRGKIGGSVAYPPDQWGRGEWTAATLEDAREMALAFADSVS